MGLKLKIEALDPLYGFPNKSTKCNNLPEIHLYFSELLL